MKKYLALLLCLGLLLTLAACGAETKIVHCDRCGAEIVVEADSNVNDEEWILFCGDCEEELYGDEPLVQPG